MDLTTPEYVPVMHFRPRRSHAKSRIGCLRCKQQRKKCDEVRPQCSRCASGGRDCEWPLRSSHTSIHDAARQPHAIAKTVHRMSPSSDESAIRDTCWAERRIKPPTHDFVSHPSKLRRADQSVLGMTEVETQLFGHYVAHTARTIPFDEAGLSALEVGIPGLALQSRPLLCSLLALAAACKCVDLLNKGPEDLEACEIVSELLTFAEARHQESVRLIQDVIHDAQQSSYVLANAAMMVCYGPASQCIRIRLSRIISPTMPQAQSDGLRYVLLTRAPYLAYAGLTFREDLAPCEMAICESSVDQCSADRLAERDLFTSTTTIPDVHIDQCHSLFPALRATYETALSDLGARSSSAFEFNGCCGGLDAFCECDRCSCESALNTLNAIYQDVFAESNQTPVKPSKALPNNAAGDLAPWLRRFVQSAVSASGIRPLRYAILNFVQRAPTGFIELIRRELGDDARISCCALVPTAELPPRCNGQLPVIALDIFAHWLVLLLLLDEVWWIGPIGDFELGRLTERVAELRSDERENKVSSTDWWPGRMHAMYKGSHTE